nr:phytosulfokines-like [Ipomoea trifida]GMD80777.1 phytosulfokines 3-like [Ipomoea batatas]GMD94655.1 phytosulfokines 3-like [Ipomoea batatas]GMD96416.1 phytosulfokines 3-like [Ipomoea batatas]GMD99478.1 phytosulfokines 3-like [Ipomoea batatas]
MSRVSSIIILAFLLSTTLAFAVRPLDHPTQLNVQGVGAEIEEEKCGGLDEDECLKRRTLNAHLDYIYTQNAHP